MKKVNSILLIALFAASAAAHAQLYKWVGPDGKVTYSDVPPPASARSVETKSVGGAGTDTGNFPFELAEAAKNHPVTLYTAEKCAPCNEGRSMLKARGVPFSEKTVTTNADMDRMRQAGGEKLPFLTIGRTKQTGFEQGTWNAALSAAGYPESNILPKNYFYPKAEAAAPAAKPAQVKQSAKNSAAGESRADDLPPAAGNAPPGFRF